MTATSAPVSTWNPFNSYIQQQLQEILAALEDPNKGGYPHFLMVAALMIAIQAHSEKLEIDLNFLDKLHDTSEALAELRRRIQNFIEKYGGRATPKPTEQEVKDFAKALADYDKTLEELKKALPRDENGNIKEGREKRMYEQGVDVSKMIKATPYRDRTLEDAIRSGVWKDMTGAFKLWSQQAAGYNRDDPDNPKEPSGPFDNWEKGKGVGPGIGFKALTSEYTTSVQIFTDKANMGGQKISTMFGASGKVIESTANLQQAINRNHTG